VLLRPGVFFDFRTKAEHHFLSALGIVEEILFFRKDWNKSPSR